MEALASFSRSEHGELYVRACRHYGVDPAAIFLPDDVLAHNARIAFYVAEMNEAAPVSTAVDIEAKYGDVDAGWAAAAEANKRAWLEGAG